MGNEFRPHDLWIEYTEEVADYMSDKFYAQNKEWIDNSKQYNDLLNLFYTWNISPGQTAKLIEGSFEIFQNKE